MKKSNYFNYLTFLAAFCICSLALSAQNLSPDGKTRSTDLDVNIRQGGQIETTVFPNPSTSLSTVKFSLKEESDVTISILNIEGKVLKQLLNEEKMSRGIQKVKINTTELSNGWYIISLSINGTMERKSLNVIR